MGNPKAAFVIIGNEILSGRTKDKNLPYLAEKLGAIGVVLKEVRVVRDVEDEIAKAVNELRAEIDYVFTSGGIGPTHDDITSESIAKAFGVENTKHPEAYKRLEDYYEGRKEFNEARQKMGYTPEGASLINNPVSIAPGFNIENVYVMAGVPEIFQAMVDEVVPGLKAGKPIESRTVTTNLLEGDLAAGLNEIQGKYEDVDIGSYPHMHDGNLGVSVVARGMNVGMLEQVAEQITGMITNLGGKVLENPAVRGK